jgi:hypothetical protein
VGRVQDSERVAGRFPLHPTRLPDGHRVITTQTGGPGALVFQHDPAGSGVGKATYGTRVFLIGEIPRGGRTYIPPSTQSSGGLAGATGPSKSRSAGELRVPTTPAAGLAQP